MSASSSTPSGFRRTWIDHTSELATDADTVFELLRDLDGWPNWTPGLSAIKRRPGPVAAGVKFAMVVKPPRAIQVTLPCKITTLRPHYIEWGGALRGSVIRHSFEVTPISATRCKVRQIEYATNLLALIALPIERLAYAHDRAWSRALEKRYA